MSDFQHNLHFSDTDPFIKGFQELVFSVSNFEKSLDFYQRICGWELIRQESDSESLKQLWHLDDSIEIEEALLYNPGDKEGFLRIVKFHGTDQVQIRSGAHVWDTGGIFDINIRTKDMEKTYRNFLQEGWNGYTDPHRYVFNIYDVSEVLLKGPDGITIAIMQRFSPPLVGFSHMKKTSRIFNSSTICRDMEVTHDFFIHKLGFSLFFQTAGTERTPGENVLGIPPNINKDITVPIDIVRPDINNFGSIEYLKLQELTGKDCSDLAKPPNLGILMLRFPVRDLESYAHQLKERGVKLHSDIQTLEIAPYGKVSILSIISPDGAWLEFMEKIE